MKSELEVRPVYLRNAGRTRGHVLVVMLALILKREPKKAVRHCDGSAARFGNIGRLDSPERIPRRASVHPSATTKRSAYNNLQC